MITLFLDNSPEVLYKHQLSYRVGSLVLLPHTEELKSKAMQGLCSSDNSWVNYLSSAQRRENEERETEILSVMVKID